MDIREGSGSVVAADVRGTVQAVDDALLHGARMCVSVLETARESHIPVAQTQKLFAALTSGLSSVVDGRGQIVTAMRQMILIKDRSNLAPRNFGCPDGWSTLASSPTEESPPDFAVAA